MKKIALVVFLFTVVLVFFPGCEKEPQIENEAEIIEKGKTDFLTPKRTATLDLGFQYMSLDPSQQMSNIPEFENIEVTSSKVFDYYLLPNKDKYWAIELAFKGMHSKTREEITGIAIMHYASHMVEGSRRENDLLYMYTGVTEEEINEIRKTSESVFNIVRKFDSVSKVLNAFK